MLTITDAKWLALKEEMAGLPHVDFTSVSLMANDFYDSVFIPLVSYIQIVQLR